MKLNAKSLLEFAFAVFLVLTLLFSTSANLTHMNCCSQQWVDSAPTANDRAERVEIRARRIKEVAALKRQSHEYALASLVCAIGSFIGYYSTRKRSRAG